MKRIILLIVLILFIVSFAYADDDSSTSDNYYVDLDRVSNGDGSFETPWNTIDSVNSNVTATGSDVFFKENTSETNCLVIDWGGSITNRAIVGCYWEDGAVPNHDCTGKTRPIIDGNTHDVDQTGRWGALVQVKTNSADYVTVEWLHVRNSGWNGISSQQNDYNIIQNCYIDYSLGNNISVSGWYNKVLDNTVVRSSYGGKRYSWEYFCECGDDCSDTGLYPYGCYNRAGASITITGDGEDPPTMTFYNEVKRNTVSRGYEGIGTYRSASGTLIEANIVKNMSSYLVYQGNGTHAIIKNNLVYEYNDTVNGENGGPDNNRDPLIFIGCETHEPDQTAPITGNATIVGNMVAGGGQGITLASTCSNLATPVWSNNNKVYNNSVVDCNEGIRIAYTNRYSTGNEIYNNSVTDTTGTKTLASGCSYNIGTWSNNMYSRTPPTGYCDDNSIVGDADHVKTSGWTNDEKTFADFRQGVDSDGIDQGLNLGSEYNDTYWKADIRPQGSGFDIGADEYEVLQGLVSKISGVSWDVLSKVIVSKGSIFKIGGQQINQGCLGNYGNETGLYSRSVYTNGRWRVVKVAVGCNGSVTKISARLKDVHNTSNEIYFGIFDDNSGVPGTNLYVSSAALYDASTNGVIALVEEAISSLSLVNKSYVWVGFQAENSTSEYEYDDDYLDGYYNDETFGSVPSDSWTQSSYDMAAFITF